MLYILYRGKNRGPASSNQITRKYQIEGSISSRSWEYVLIGVHTLTL